MSSNEDASESSRRIRNPAIGAVLEPQVDVFGDDSSALQSGAADAHDEKRDAELDERREKSPLTLGEGEDGVARGIA